MPLRLVESRHDDTHKMVQLQDSFRTASGQLQDSFSSGGTASRCNFRGCPDVKCSPKKACADDARGQRRPVTLQSAGSARAHRPGQGRLFAHAAEARQPVAAPGSEKYIPSARRVQLMCSSSEMTYRMASAPTG
jgi:hypothetical protein